MAPYVHTIGRLTQQTVWNVWPDQGPRPGHVSAPWPYACITQSVILAYRSSSTVFWSRIFDLTYRLVCNVCDRLLLMAITGIALMEAPNATVKW